MMTRMAKKLDIGAYETIRHHRFGARGGGRRRAKPLLQYSKKHWMKELGDGCWHASPNHLMPRGLVGLGFMLLLYKILNFNLFEYIYIYIVAGFHLTL